jgi:hypothetical protein
LEEQALNGRNRNHITVHRLILVNVDHRPTSDRRGHTFGEDELLGQEDTRTAEVGEQTEIRPDASENPACLTLNAPRSTDKLVRGQKQPVGVSCTILSEAFLSVCPFRVHLDVQVTRIRCAIKEREAAEAMQHASHLLQVDDHACDVARG